MTFKHIDFYDSPVMRELERQVIKSKNISAPTVADIVKNAWETRSIPSTKFTSTGDLFVDLLHLAEGLRERGFISNANVLEQKIFAYKKAAQYNSELSSAHPDGDITMDESATDGLGDVETLESTHEKMLEVINKIPTGKQAALVANILKASEVALELKKKAQDPTVEDSAEDIFSGRSAGRTTIIKEINTFLATQFPKIAGILKNKDVDPNKWGFTYSALFSGTPAYRVLYASRAGLDSASVERFFQSNESLYGKDFSGDELAKITAVLQSYAQAKDFNKLIGYANIVGGDIANKYFFGSQPNSKKREYATENPDKANSQMFRDNSNSIWKWYEANIWEGAYNDFALDQTKLLAAAREIQQTHYLNFQSLFSEDKLAQATAKIQEEIKGIIVPWDEVTTFFEKNPELPPNISSIASLTMAINAQIEKLKPYGSEGVLYKKLVELATIVFPGWTPNLAVRATEAAQEIILTVNFLNSKPLSSGDIIIQDTSKAVATLLGAAKMYWEAGKQAAPKSQTARDYAQNQKVTFNLAKAVKAATGKPYASLYEAVKSIFPNATSYEKLVQEAQNWLQESASITGYPVEEFNIQTQALEQINSGFKKIAQGLVRRKPTGPTKPAADMKEFQGGDASVGEKKPTTTPTTGGVGRASLGLTKANMNDPKEVAVAIMQQYLAYFAEALANAKDKFKDYDIQDVARIIRTGPKANPAVNTYDGKWGSETQGALELADKYLKQLGITGLDTKARYVNRVTSADAESVGKKNAALLGQATQMLGGRSSTPSQQIGASTVYDRLPDHIDWNIVEYPLMQHRIPVTAQDLSSLSSMYDLVIKNNWAQPKYTKDRQGFDIEGLTAGNLLFIIRWFQQRAQFVYNSSIRSDKTAAALARQYYDSAKKLENQLAAFLSARGGITPESARNIVDIEALREYATTAPGARGRGGLGEEKFQGDVSLTEIKSRRTPGGTSGYQYADYRSGEGTDWKSPTGGSAREEDGPPIGPDGTINLASRWFNGLDEKLGVSHNPLLNPELFKRYTAGDLARTFYANAGGSMDDQARRQALVASGVEVEGYDEGAGDYIVFYYDPITRRKQRTYAMRVPAYQRAYKARLTAGPMRSFGALLQSISAALAPAIAEWMQTAQPNDTAKQAEQAWHTEWQRILGLRANEAAGV